VRVEECEHGVAREASHDLGATDDRARVGM
jgi:hypothetical protein